VQTTFPGSVARRASAEPSDLSSDTNARAIHRVLKEK
jgi:hypothetical protein